MKNKTNFVFALAGVLLLAACGQTATSSTESKGGATSSAAGGSSASGGDGECPAGISWSDPGYYPGTQNPLADGVFDYTEADYEEKLDILAALENYALRNHLAGIPLYDDSSYQRFSDRITLPTTKYITNYGFGVGEATIDADGKMNDAVISESKSEWKSYFHGYTSTDSGTFNYWNSTGADVADRYSMVAATYYEVEMNDTKTDYQWTAGLAKQAEPIQLKRVGTGADATLEVETDSSVKTSLYWRVPLKTGDDGIVYNVADTSKWATKYRGRKVELEDYITPYKAMFDNRLARATGFGDDASGFKGVLDYIYGGKDWSSVGIQLNEAEGAIDFTFNTAKTMKAARTSLGSSLASPVPQEFLDDIGGVGNYGKHGDAVNGDHTTGLDNIISCGVYIPEYWETDKRLVFKKNDLYYDKDRYHFDGVTEDVFAGASADTAAYQAFLNNQLDEVTIPVKYVKDDHNKPKVYHTQGSTILKLNINSTTEDEWEYYFGTEGTVYKHTKTEYYPVKPLMSNEFFLDGVYYSIDRAQLAEISGKNHALGYLSDAYTQDPDGEEMYRNTAQGKSVLQDIIDQSDEYGHNDSIAQDAFKMALRKGWDEGYIECGEEYEVTCLWRYQDTINNLGDYIKGYVEDNFNAAAKSLGFEGTTLTWINKVAGTQYTDCYTKMDHGEFDFAEGAISGNVLNPLNFMNTVCTNELAQGFCLNWGHPTEKVFADDPIVYNDMAWSYDALFKAATSTAVVVEGVNEEIARNARLEPAENGGISLVVDYPEIMDDDGHLLIEFSASEGGIFGSADGTFTSGYYASNPQMEAANGSFYYTVNADDVKRVQNYVAKQGGECNYYLIQCELAYTFGEKTFYKSIYATASAAELGL
ncbi:MAG: hypothetical protein K6F32_01325 [Bacilli bacterium]|nr:hypothetical protein [Bacilli bacterium]